MNDFTPDIGPYIGPIIWVIIGWSRAGRGRVPGRLSPPRCPIVTPPTADLARVTPQAERTALGTTAK